jgi:hypothetical protein
VATIVEVDAPRPSVARISAGDAILPVEVAGLRDLPATISVTCSLQVDKDSRLRCFNGATAIGPDVIVVLNGLNTKLNFRISEVHYSQHASEAHVRARFAAPAGLRSEVKAGDRDIGAKAFPSGVMATIVSVAPEAATDLTAVIALQPEQTPTGWTYKAQPIKVGAHFTFETPRYTMQGIITGVELPELKGQ